MDEAAFKVTQTLALAVSALLGRELKRTTDPLLRHDMVSRVNELAVRMDRLRHEQEGGPS